MCRKLFILIVALVSFIAASAQADKAEENYQAGRQLRRDGKCTEAIPLFKKAIEQKPTFAAAHYELGWCYNELGQYNIALPILQQAVKLEPTGFRSLYEAGFAKYKLGRVEEALVDFNQVIKLNANYEKVYIARGDLYKDAKKNTAAALADFLKALSLDSTEKKIHYRIGWCYNDLGKFSDAVPYLQKATGFEEQNYLSYSELGFSLFSLNRFDEAMGHLNKANTLKPGFETTIYYIGLCHVKQNKKQDAVQKYNELVQLNSNYAALLLNEIKLMK